MTRTAMEILDVRVRFGGKVALDIDHLRVEEGKIVGIVGANGAGKTTLFDVISGFVRPESGSVQVFDGTEILRRSTQFRARAGIGRSFQAATLFPSMTVADTIMLALQSRRTGGRVPRRRLRAEADELIDAMGLGAYYDRPVGALSTGTRRIVDLVSALALRPKILMLDEPGGGVAQSEIEELAGFIRRIQRELRCTMMVVEHDIPLIRELSDELVALEVGRVIAAGEPATVLRDPEVVRAYLGTNAVAIERSGRAGAKGRERG